MASMIGARTNQLHLRPRDRAAPTDGTPIWPGAIYPRSAVQPAFICAGTLDGLVAAVDPRLWLAAPPSWTASQLAINLALAAMWTIGAPNCSARWLASRCRIPQAEVPAALATAARGPGHPVARLDGSRVVLERADAQLRRPALYWRLPVADVARCSDVHQARAWFLFGQAAAAVGAGHTVILSVEQWREALALRPNADIMSVLIRAARGLGEHFAGHELVVVARLDGGPVIGAPRTAFRTRWMPPQVLRAVGIADGHLAGRALSVGKIESLRAWLYIREERGVDGHFGAVRALWLAVVSAAAEGCVSPVPCYSVSQLMRDLDRVGAVKAFDTFTDALAEVIGSRKAERKPLPWMIHREDAKKLFAAQAARAKGEELVRVGTVRLVDYVPPRGVPAAETLIEQAIIAATTLIESEIASTRGVPGEQVRAVAVPLLRMVLTGMREASQEMCTRATTYGGPYYESLAEIVVRSPGKAADFDQAWLAYQRVCAIDPAIYDRLVTAYRATKGRAEMLRALGARDTLVLALQVLARAAAEAWHRASAEQAIMSQRKTDEAEDHAFEHEFIREMDDAHIDLTEAHMGE